MKRIFLLTVMIIFGYTIKAQQILWDTIISFGPGRDIPAYIYSDGGANPNTFYIVGYTENTGNGTTDPFVYHMNIQPGSYSFSDSVYHTPGHFERIFGASYGFTSSFFDIVGSDSVPGQDINTFDQIYDPSTGFSTPNINNLSTSSTDEYTCVSGNGSQAKTSYGTIAFGYAMNGGYKNITYSIDGNTPALISSPNNNNCILHTHADSYTLSSYAVGYSDSLGTDNMLLSINQYGLLTFKTIGMSGNQRLFSSAPYPYVGAGAAEYGAGYSDAYGSKDAFLVSFDPYSLDTLWTLTMVTPSSDEVVLASLIKDSVIFLFGNITMGTETDIFVRKVNLNTHTLVSEYILGAPGVKDSVVGITPNTGCDMMLLTTQGNDIHLYKLPCYNFSLTATDISCYGNNDGAINATPEFSSGFQITYYDSIFSMITPVNLSIGKYFIEMVDTPNYYCLLMDSVIIHEPDSLVISTINVVPTCFADSNGIIDISVYGGTPGFSFNWVGPVGYSSTTEDIDSLFAGSYSLTVTDTNGCQQQIAPITISENPEIFITPDSIKPVLCNGGTDGAIYITVSGGTPGYVFSWADTGTFTAVYEDLWNLPASQYFLTVSDTFGCQKIDTFFIQEPLALTVNDSVYDVTCQGLNDGAINLILSGGTSPYTFYWTGPNGFTASTNSVSGLETGNYAYTVTDINGCSINGSYSLTAPPPANITGTLTVPSYGTVDVGDALIYLYKDTSFSGSAYQIATYDSTVVMFNGDFSFNSLYSADYYLMAKIISQESIYDDVVTTYYDTVVNWFDAIPVTLQCGDNDTVQMQMIELPPLTGTGSISGYIYMDGAKAMGEPVPGAEVFAEQEPDEHPVANSTTNSAGFYYMDGLPLGAKTLFKLTVDIPGLPLMSTYTGIGLDATNDSIVNMNFVVDTTTGGGIYVDTTSYFSVHNVPFFSAMSIYPNPFSKNLNIEFTTENAEDVNIEIIDISGRVVYVKNIRSIVGKNQVEINTQTNISGSGTFFLKITSGNNVLIKKIIKR